MTYTVHEFFGGYLQRAGLTNGVARLALELDATLDPYRHGVAYHPYRIDTLDRARFLAFSEPFRDCDIRVNVYGFSYGCDTAERFCGSLEAVGLRPNCVVLCDPVKRFRYLYTMAPRWLRASIDWLTPALDWLRMGRPALRLPASAARVDVFTQTVAPPWPSRVYHGDRLVEAEQINYPHVHMDNSAEFRERVKFVASRSNEA